MGTNNAQAVLATIRERATLDGGQIKSILDQLVPLIAKPEDHEFFRGILGIMAAEVNSSTFAAFVAKLIREQEAKAPAEVAA